MPKKNNDALEVPKIVITIGKVLQTFSIPLAVSYAKKLFTTPIRHKLPKREIEMDKNSLQEELYIPSLNRTIVTYKYGKGSKKVLLIHGWSGRGTQLVKIADALLDKGYSTISFDAPAHGKSSGKSTLMPEFIACVLEIYKQNPEIEFAVGHSLGAMTLLNAVKQGFDIKKGVIIGSGNSVIEIVENFVKAIQLKPKIAIGIQKSFERNTLESMESYSAYIAAKKVKCPILVIHDKNDVEVGYHCSVQIDKVLENGTLLLTEKLGHKKILGNEKVISEVVDFIAN